MSNLKESLEQAIQNDKATLRELKLKVLEFILQFLTAIPFVRISKRFYPILDKNKAIEGYVIKVAVTFKQYADQLENFDFDKETSDNTKKGSIRTFYIVFNTDFEVVKVKNSAYYVPIALNTRFNELVSLVLGLYSNDLDFLTVISDIKNTHLSLIETQKRLSLIGRKFADFDFFNSYFKTNLDTNLSGDMLFEAVEEVKEIWIDALFEINTNEIQTIANKILLDLSDVHTKSAKCKLIRRRISNCEPTQNS